MTARPLDASATSTVPGAPTGASVVAGNARATLQWTAPASNGGSPVTGYVVTPFLAGVAQPARPFNSTATSQIVTGLTNTKSYTFTVAAKNVVGTGPRSVATAPILVGLPTAPTNVVVAASLGTATVRWNPPANNGGVTVSGYVVTPYKAGVAQTPRSFASQQPYRAITGLTNNVLYTFTVAARNPNGTGVTSAATVPITIGVAKVSTAPSAVSAVSGNSRVTLSWVAPSSNGSASVTAYLVTPYVGGVAKPRRTFDARTQQIITGLANATAYRFSVIAVNAAGNSAASTLSGPLVVGAPTVPTSVSATPVNGQQVTVSWGVPVSNNGLAITGYIVTPYIGTVAQTPMAVGVTTVKVFTGLLHTRTYTFRVAAKNGSGTGLPSVSNLAQPNSVPVAHADSYTTNEDTHFDVAAPGLFANDTDADHDPLQIELVTFPGGGIDISPDGSFAYDPALNADNDDSFSYRVGDGFSWSAPVRVDIDIIAENDPPIVEGEQYEIAYGETLDVPSPGVLANDYDPIEFDGVSASGPLSGPAHGSLVLRSDGSFTYTPDPGYSGVDGFSYLVSDSQPGGIGNTEIDIDPPEDGGSSNATAITTRTVLRTRAHRW